MAALQEPNPYELHPQPTPHAEPGHVHRYAVRSAGYVQRCIYCDVQETFALRAENAELKARDRRKDAAILKLYRDSASKRMTIKDIRQELANYIALAQWPDEQRNDDDR